jgi:hypothetical protein
MKTVAFLALSFFFSFNSFARINTANCPNQITIQYQNISRLPYSAEISQSAFLDQSFKSVIDHDNKKVTFNLLTRTTETLCVYTNHQFAAYLQTNNGIDELMIPYNELTFFRTKVSSVSTSQIELTKDSDSFLLLAPDYQIDSDGGLNVINEVPVATAESIYIEVK